MYLEPYERCHICRNDSDCVQCRTLFLQELGVNGDIIKEIDNAILAAMVAAA